MSDDDKTFLDSISAHRDRLGDTSRLNPEFAGRLSSAIRQAQAAGLPIKVMSAYRDDNTTGSKYDREGYSAHGYGLATDIDGLDGPNGKITKQWAEIAALNGIHNPYGVGNKSEYNHWQLPEQPLEQTPGLLKRLQEARATGDFNNVWSAYSQQALNASAQPSHPHTPTPGPVMFGGLNPNARGMRNNNPGNLVDNKWTQSLPGYKGSDGRFAIFDTPEHGAAALDNNLAGYGHRGINTPLGIASTWAPAGDHNDPNSYGAQIAKALGIGINDKIDLDDAGVRTKIAQAIGTVENGVGNSIGTRVVYGGGTVGTAPTAVADSAPKAGFPTSVGDAIAKLTAKDEKSGKSALDNLGDSIKPPAAPQSSSSPMLEAPPDSGGNMQAAQALLQSTLAAQAKPLTWTTTPWGTGIAGPQTGVG